MKQGLLVFWLFITIVVSGNTAELKRSDWNLVSVCQDINSSDINMSGIDEIQNQDGLSIYTGSYAEFTNLHTLEAGYGYWVKGEVGTNFNGGEAFRKLVKPLRRESWNLMASCDNISVADINMTGIFEIQSQNGRTIYTGSNAKYSNLKSLENGYGYWVKGDINGSFISKYALTLPLGFDYQLINNKGKIQESILSNYTVKLYSNFQNTLDSQLSHVGVVVSLNGNEVPIMQIQENYRGHEVVVGVYDSRGTLLAVSDRVLVDSASSVQFISLLLSGLHSTPTALDDNVTVDSDKNITIDVLENDMDIDLNDSKSLLAVGLPSLGTVTIINNRILYIPTLNSNGVDSFSYTMQDSSGLESNATVRVRVVDKTSPSLPSLIAAPPTETSDKNVTVELSGEVGSSVYVNGVGVATVRADGTVNVTLDTSSREDSSFEITLQDSSGNESDAISFTIIKDNLVVTTTHAELKGNLSNADVRIYRVEENSDKTLLFKETTDENGEFPDHKDALEDNKFYIYEVSGGVDTNNSVDNNGTIRAVVKGAWVNSSDSGVSVSLASEMAYVFVAKDLKYDFNATKIEDKLNRVVETVLISDISGDGNLTFSDLLLFDYQNNLSVFNNLYKDIYLNIYSNNLEYTQNIIESTVANYNVNAQAKGLTLSADGNRVFMADGVNGLMVLDITNPINPLKISEFNTKGQAYRVTLSADETKAFVSDSSNGLVIIDISDITTLKKIGEFTNGGKILDVALSKDETKAFLASSEGLVIVDISDASNPIEISRLNIGGDIAKLALSHDDTTIFAVRYNNSYNSDGGLYVIDVNNPNAPIRKDFKSMYKAMDVELSPDGSKLLVSGNILWIINIEENNTLGSSTFIKPGSTYGVCFVDSNQTALVANGSNGLSLLKGREVVKKFQTKDFALDVKVSKDKTKAFVADNEGGLEVIDLSGLVDSIEIDHYTEEWGSAQEVILSNDESKAFIAYNEGLVIVDTSNPKMITKISQFETSAKPKGVALSKDETKAFVADEGNGLFILDISNPQNPEKIGHYLNEEMNNITSVVLSRDETKAFVSNMWDNNGLLILDISDPTNPQKIAHCQTDGYANQVLISKDETRAFIADRTKGLKIIDITNPQKPVQVGSYRSNYVNKLALSDDGTKAFLAVPSTGLVIVDIEDPSNIQKVAQYRTGSQTSGVILSDDTTKVFLADGDNGMLIIDVRDLSNPKKVMHYATADRAVNITLSKDNSKAFVADRRNGFLLFDVELFNRIQNRPIVIVEQETQQINEIATVIAPIGSKILLDGNDTGIMVPKSRKATIELDTSGTDGNKTFELSYINIAGVQSDIKTVVIKKDTTPKLISYLPKKTKENTLYIPIKGEIGATIYINGIEYGVIGSNGTQTIELDTSGVDGDKVFNITLVGHSGTQSRGLAITIERDTTPPLKPTLTDTPLAKTYNDHIEVEVNGEVNSTIVVNGIDTEVIGSTGKKLILLDTSGEEGNKTFEILLRDSLNNISQSLIIVIRKELIDKSIQDSDNDYIPDAIEVLIGSDLNSADENSNGILDGLEVEGDLGDIFFDKQWHLRNLTNVGHDMDLLNLYHRYMGYNKGNPIIVQVVDDGVDADHEDLIDNMDLSRSYYHSSLGDEVGDPSSQSDNTHGTMVAGIIGARAFNGKGVRGIVPFAKIAGSNYLDYSFISTLEKVWLTGDGANEIAVSNNSWGQAVENLPNSDSSYETIMEEGSRSLRDGKGRIYVFAAANDREEGSSANLDYTLNNRFVVTVAGVEASNRFAYYSNPGGNILVSGYTGGIGTTINEGMGGSQTWEADQYKNYTYKMNGTSAAAPMVSGSVALVLEACPELGWRDVRYLLAKHAKRVDESNESWVQNSAGLWYSPDYGYGLVNPQGMIDDCNSSYVNLSQEKSFETYGDINFTLEDEQAVTLGGLDVDENMTVEWVELTVDANHTKASDYKIELISPAGTKMNVIDPTSILGAWMENGYRLGSAGFVGENSLGSWQVKISDFDITGEKLSGTIKSLKLKVYGH